jgi:hypothetical protein
MGILITRKRYLDVKSGFHHHYQNRLDKSLANLSKGKPKNRINEVYCYLLKKSIKPDPAD